MPKDIDRTGRLADLIALFHQCIGDACLRVIIIPAPFRDGVICHVEVMIGDRILFCTTKKDLTWLEDEANRESLVRSFSDGVAMWRKIGPPYKVISTDKKYKAFFTDEQKGRMTEVFMRR